MNTMFIHGRPVMHMVDEAINFSAPFFIRNKSTSEICGTIQCMWSLIFLGYPDYLVVDQGYAYISKEMYASAEVADVILDEASIESAGSIVVVEQYHASMRIAYERIRMDADQRTGEQKCLDLAVSEINCKMRPEGLCTI